MAIRLVNSCQHCEHVLSDSMCKVHGVKVNGHYTCDSFGMIASLNDGTDCAVCSRFGKELCTNPGHAAPKMKCAEWAPKEAVA